MDFKAVLSTIVLLIIISACQSTTIEHKYRMSLELDEINGIKKYQAGEYEEAFNLLKEPATWGYKGAQYAVAFMFLKGQHVEQSTVLGMGWLGVATEMETEDWSAQYRSFYAAADPELQHRIDKVVQEFIRRYGMKAQNITCQKSPTSRTRAVKHTCTQSNNIGTLYDMDLTEEALNL